MRTYFDINPHWYMYIKRNIYWLRSFSISLHFVRLIPKRFWIYRKINLGNSAVTEKQLITKSCYILSILMWIYQLVSKIFFFYILHFRYTPFGILIPNGLMYPIWAIGPILFNMYLKLIHYFFPTQWELPFHFRQ